MTILLKSDHLTISYRDEKNYFQLVINYKQFNNKLNELYKTNVFFSTYLVNESVDGFLRLEDNLYVRLLVKHRLGSIVNIDDEFRNNKLVKMKIAPNKEKIVIFISLNIFKKMKFGYYENKFSIPFPLLKDFYIDLTLASDYKSIANRGNKKAVNHRKVINKDRLESDRNRTRWSQNADGCRKSNELFSGSGNNISRKSRYIK